jgi:hypothetical protein
MKPSSPPLAPIQRKRTSQGFEINNEILGLAEKGIGHRAEHGVHIPWEFAESWG